MAIARKKYYKETVTRGPGPRAAAVLRVPLATLSTYLIGFPLTAMLVCLGVLVALVRWRWFLRAGLAFWSNLAFWLVGRRLHVRGRENLATGEAYVVVANHSSMYDIPALMAAVPGIAIVGRDYLWRIPLLGSLLRTFRYVPIDTRSARKALWAMDEAGKLARGGTSVGIFPEGTRTTTGRLQDFRRGFIRVVRASGRDVMPVMIRGTFALKPKGRLFPDPRERIEVTLLPPIAYAKLAGLGDPEIIAEVKAVMAEEEGGRDGTR